MARKTSKMQSITDEQWNSVNKVNKELGEDFLDYCYTIDLSPSTIVGYRSDIKIIMVYFKHVLEDKSFFEIKKKDVAKFQNFLLKRGQSPSRIRRLRSAMSSLSNYIENMLDDDYPNFRNIINKIPAPTLAFVREKTILSEEQVDKLINDLVKEGDIQKACFIAVLAASGMRKSEVVQCDFSWYFGNPIIQNGMYVSPEIRTKGSGSAGKKLKKFTIASIAQKYLDLWKEERERLGIDIDALFVVKRNGEWQRIQDSTISSWMDRFSYMTDEDCYSHLFRHYSFTYLKRNNVSIDKIRDFAGHNDSSTTEIYIDIDKSENLEGMLSFLDKEVE